MAAVYVDDEDVWKCKRHPSKRRRTGICHLCLRERLATLCPKCANVRPCPCSAPAPATTSSSSDSSSSSSRFAAAGDGVRVSKLLDSEPSFRRSRSVAFPFLRSRSRAFGGGSAIAQMDFDSGGDRSKSPSFWSSFFRLSHRSNRSEGSGEYDAAEATEKTKAEGKGQQVEEEAAAMRRTMMRKSRSVAVPLMSSNFGGSGIDRPPAKSKRWHFPSPMKAFRNSKISKIVSERSPVYRG